MAEHNRKKEKLNMLFNKVNVKNDKILFLLKLSKNLWAISIFTAQKKQNIKAEDYCFI